jgi:hypothetical protein
MRKYLSNLFVFFLLLYAVNSLIAVGFGHRVKFDLWNRHHWLLAKSNQDFDVTFVGSSRVMNTIDPDLIAVRSGVSCLNLGVGGAGATDNFLILQSFLKKNRTKTVFLQVDYLLFHNYFSYPFSDYIWLCYDDDPIVRQALIEQRGAFRYYIWRAMPFLRFLEFSSQYRFFIGQELPKADSAPANGGVHTVDAIRNKPDKKYVVFHSDPKAVQDVRRIVELCKEHGVRLVLFQAPLPVGIEDLTDRTISDDFISQFASEYGLEYWDFSRVYYNRPELFVDRHHLNAKGVALFSELLAEKLLQD